MKIFDKMKVKIFADGADISGMVEMSKSPLIKGFTTNPTLMKKAGVKNYELFARQALAKLPGYPISFEVFSDELDEMATQAQQIANWGENVYVKIPISNTRGESTTPLINNLSQAGVKLNVTAIFTMSQIKGSCEALKGGAPAVVSVFAGRIADTGIDPVPVMKAARELTGSLDEVELLWASPRELLNILQADDVGCDIITVSNDLLAKLKLIGKDLEAFSLETVKMFYDDACKAGYELTGPRRQAA